MAVSFPDRAARRVLVFALLLPGAVGCNLSPSPPAVAEPAEGRPATVKALGRLEPAGGVLSIGVPVPDRLGEVLVREGDLVEKGQELARLDSHADRLAERDLAASQLEEAKARLAAVTASGEKQLEEAKIQIQQVREIEPLDLQAQAEKVGLLDQQLANAVKNLERIKSLQATAVPKQELERQELAVSQARTELATARSLLDKTRRSYEFKLRAAEAQLETLRAGLERARKEIPVKSLESSLRLAEERLKHTILRAPVKGQVLKLLARTGELVGTQPVLRMGETRHMVAIAEVYETDVRHVRPGQPATVTSPALPHELRGTVEQVCGTVARNNVLDVDPTLDADRRVVEVRVRLADSTDAARFVNLQVRIAIAVAP
jgi:HlyD family secretion protein